MRWLVGGVFVWAAIAKSLNLKAFAVAIGDLGLVYDNLVMPTAVFLIAAELIGGLGLMLGIRGSLAIVAALLVTFTAVAAYGLWLGLDIECGCFGVGDLRHGGPGLQIVLWRNTGLLTCCIYLAVGTRMARKQSAGAASDRP